MRIDDPDILTRFRGHRICEACYAVGWCDAAHIFSRGAGGPDVAFNLVSLGSGLGWRCHCHGKSHYGDGAGRDKLLGIVARRERCTQDDIKSLVDGIRFTLPKEPTAGEVRLWLTTLSPRAREMAAAVPKLARILGGA